MDVVKLNIWGLVGWFVLYVGLHMDIGMWKQHLEKAVDKTQDDVDNLKVATTAFKWFPFVYVIFVILILIFK